MRLDGHNAPQMNRGQRLRGNRIGDGGSGSFAREDEGRSGVCNTGGPTYCQKDYPSWKIRIKYLAKYKSSENMLCNRPRQGQRRRDLQSASYIQDLGEQKLDSGL